MKDEYIEIPRTFQTVWYGLPKNHLKPHTYYYISVSEIASLLGYNRYMDKYEAFVKVLIKNNHKLISKLHDVPSSKHKKPRFKLKKTASTQLLEKVCETSLLPNIVSQNNKLISDDDEKELEQILMDDTNESSDASASMEKDEVAEIQEMINSNTQEVGKAQTVILDQREMISFSNRFNGIINEDKVRDFIIKKKNISNPVIPKKTIYIYVWRDDSKIYVTRRKPKNVSYLAIGGRADLLSDDTVYEIKNRQKKLYRKSFINDEIQMLFYMYMYGKNKCVLLEHNQNRYLAKVFENNIDVLSDYIKMLYNQMAKCTNILNHKEKKEYKIMKKICDKLLICDM
jgi:hypothetical protein